MSDGTCYRIARGILHPRATGNPVSTPRLGAIVVLELDRLVGIAHFTNTA